MIQFKSIAALSILAILSACGDDPIGAEVGSITGTVTVIGDPLPDGGGDIYLERNPDAPRGEARKESLDGGPRAYTFRMDEVEPGSYYLEACLRSGPHTGCAPFTTDPTGNPTPIQVVSGEEMDVELRF